MIAEIARGLGALTIGVVTRPFSFEGRRRAVQADTGVQRLKEKVDTLIVIPNDRLLTVANDKTSVLNAFKMADEVLLQGVSGITNLITTPGLINTDFADVKMVLSQAGSALMGIGQASGDDRAVSAAKAAISSPLLESAIDGARGVLLNITGPSSMGLFEMNAAAEIIHGVAHPDANIIFGTVIDDEMGDEVKVTVIAAGFDRLDGAGRRCSGRSRRRRSPSCSPRTRPIRSTPTTTTTSTSRRSCADDRSPVRRPAGQPGRGAGPHRRRRRRRAVELLAVTKGFGPSRRRGGGRRLRGDRGELRPGAASPRPTAVAAAGVAVHFIGQLQSNKVRQRRRPRRRVGDRRPPGLVAELAQRAPGATVLSRSTRRGSPARAAARSPTWRPSSQAAADAGLVVDGLMTVGPTDGGPEAARPAFRAVRALVDQLGLRTCSMGMSDDLEVAVEEGTTRPPRHGPVRPALSDRAPRRLVARSCSPPRAAFGVPASARPDRPGRCGRPVARRSRLGTGRPRTF